MRKYAYIKEGTFAKKGNDYTWNIYRIEEDGYIKIYKGIETSRDLSSYSNIVVIGNKEEYNEWFDEHKPEEGY